MTITTDAGNTLKTLIAANKITTNYTDEQLESLIQQSLLLVNAPYTTDTTYNDYIHEYDASTYITQYYPIKNVLDIECTLDGTAINEYIVHATRDGIIYFDRSLRGRLEVTYTVGLDNTDINNYILPIALYLVKDLEGKNINSIQEGDVTVQYQNMNTSTSAGIDALIANLRSRYGARVRLI